LKLQYLHLKWHDASPDIAPPLAPALLPRNATFINVGDLLIAVVSFPPCCPIQ